MPLKLGYYAGAFNSFLEEGLSNEKVKDRYIKWSKDQQEKERISLQIVNILKTKSGAISPKDFWKDLFFFAVYLKSLEEEILRFNDADFKKTNIPTLEKRFQNICKATLVLNGISVKLLATLDKLIVQEGKIPHDNYEKIMEKEVNDAIHYLIHKPWKGEIKQSYLKFIEKFLPHENEKNKP